MIRTLTAFALLKAGSWLLDRAARPAPDSRAPIAPSPYRPAELTLVGSIVGLAICTLWIWLSARAGS